MRPRTLDEVVGQAAPAGARARALGDAIRRGDVGSVILWGPPGTGKTTLAHLIAPAHRAGVRQPFSAVTEGVPRRAGDPRARRRSGAGWGGTRSSSATRSTGSTRRSRTPCCPPSKRALITLIGATTENPSFELNAALLSRLAGVRARAAPGGRPGRAAAPGARRPGARPRRAWSSAVTDDAHRAPGDGGRRRRAARADRARGGVAAGGPRRRRSRSGGRGGRASRAACRAYDKSGEEHFNLLSALPQVAAGQRSAGRALLDGPDDRGRARIRWRSTWRGAWSMAAEDIGLADPQALTIAVAARGRVHFLGAPEGGAAAGRDGRVYLATAPKSNRVYAAWGAALEAARRTPAAPVPLHLRNALTGLMKDLGYGEGYRYAHDAPSAYLSQEYLPDRPGGRAVLRARADGPREADRRADGLVGAHESKELLNHSRSHQRPAAGRTGHPRRRAPQGLGRRVRHAGAPRRTRPAGGHGGGRGRRAADPADSSLPIPARSSARARWRSWPRWWPSTGATLVIFDDELSPMQGANLERELKVRVMDRAEVILDIFSTRARSHEAKLQVELAQLEYLLPRLTPDVDPPVAYPRRHRPSGPGRNPARNRPPDDPAQDPVAQGEAAGRGAPPRDDPRRPRPRC